MAGKAAKPATKRVAVLAENIYEDLEAWYPILRLREAGHEVVVVAPLGGHTYTSKHGYPLASDLAIDKAKAKDFDAVVIPGGYAPDKLRRYPKIVAFIRAIFDAGKPVASICHGPWLFAEADIARGRRFTCVPAIKTDVVNAGGIYEDREVVVDGNLVSSRTPPDLPAMMRELLRLLDRS
ncbi:MAG: type 1 glutamine amidotransferase domain-containing protein [Candidatus Sumerlaeia bacterium]|nr:type 1 glutamine amidotransferase domain-containing protein [Candidatus Sumerlaeia bacterium]